MPTKSKPTTTHSTELLPSAKPKPHPSARRFLMLMAALVVIWFHY